MDKIFLWNEKLKHEYFNKSISQLVQSVKTFFKFKRTNSTYY